jgi:hypothetical protein
MGKTGVWRTASSWSSCRTPPRRSPCRPLPLSSTSVPMGRRDPQIRVAAPRWRSYPPACSLPTELRRSSPLAWRQREISWGSSPTHMLCHGRRCRPIRPDRGCGPLRPSRRERHIPGSSSLGSRPFAPYKLLVRWLTDGEES